MDAAFPETALLQLDRRNDAHNIIEAVGNLLYLIQLDAAHPELVRSYVRQAEERLSRLGTLIPSPAYAVSRNTAGATPPSC